MKTLKVVLIGAGNRGQTYTNLMKDDDRFQVVGVAEPKKEQRDFIKNNHGLPDKNCFDTWEELLEQPQFADLAIIATSDRGHFAPAMKALEKGYDLLLEKPAAPTYEECMKIEKLAKEKGSKVLVCHVLRYTPFFKKIKTMIDEGKVGKVLSIHHCECVGNVHQSHSYVRGNWGNTEKSAPMILAKACHDMDILQWLIGSDCSKVHSFGSLSYFRKENAPEGSPEYCIEGCPYADTCYYNAVKLYLDDKENLWFREAATKDKKPSDEIVAKALRKTQYGKCVYKCDNDVVDHQVVNLEFENSAVASFNMSAFNYNGRTIRIMGTDGEIWGEWEKEEIEYFDFATREHTYFRTADALTDQSILGGHGGGDAGIVNDLYSYIVGESEGNSFSEIGISVKNHAIAFAAEESRLTGKVVDMREYRNSFEGC